MGLAADCVVMGPWIDVVSFEAAHGPWAWGHSGGLDGRSHVTSGLGLKQWTLW